MPSPKSVWRACVWTIALCALGAMCPLGAAVSHAREQAPALAARTISLDEHGSLRLTSKHGFTLNEQGVASGTIAGTIYVHLSLVSTSRASAEVSIYLRGGSLTGRASASYQRTGQTNTFAGTMTIVRGSGSYGHVHGSGLSFSGTIQEARGDRISVQMRGAVTD